MESPESPEQSARLGTKCDEIASMLEKHTPLQLAHRQRYARHADELCIPVPTKIALLWPVLDRAAAAATCLVRCPERCRRLQSVLGQMQSGGKIALPRSLCTLMVSRIWSLARSHKPSKACPTCQSWHKSQPRTAATSAFAAVTCQCCACSVSRHMRNPSRWVLPPLPPAAALMQFCTSYASAAAATSPCCQRPSCVLITTSSALPYYPPLCQPKIYPPIKVH